mgnify:CR=1 FL=1
MIPFGIANPVQLPRHSALLDSRYEVVTTNSVAYQQLARATMIGYPIKARLQIENPLFKV